MQNEKDSKGKSRMFRVRFLDRDEKQPIESIVKSVGPSEFFGLVCLDGLVFADSSNGLILPEQEALKRRFGNSQRLHIPYHNIVYVEEFSDNQAEVHAFPFIRSVKRSSDISTDSEFS